MVWAVLAAELAELANVIAQLDKGNSSDITAHFGEKEKTLLHHAVKNKATRVAQEIITRGANINAVDGYGATPLHTAAFCGTIGTMTVLLANGADTTIVDSAGFTALHYAVEEGRIEAAKLLLEKKADSNAIIKANDKFKYYHTTPLHIAAQHASNDLILLLLVKGADPSIHNGAGDRAEDVFERIRHGVISFQDLQRTPLRIQEAAKALVEVDLNQSNNEEKKTPNVIVLLVLEWKAMKVYKLVILILILVVVGLNLILWSLLIKDMEYRVIH